MGKLKATNRVYVQQNGFIDVPDVIPAENIHSYINEHKRDIRWSGVNYYHSEKESHHAEYPWLVMLREVDYIHEKPHDVKDHDFIFMVPNNFAEEYPNAVQQTEYFESMLRKIAKDFFSTKMGSCTIPPTWHVFIDGISKNDNRCSFRYLWETYGFSTLSAFHGNYREITALHSSQVIVDVRETVE